MPPKGKPVRAYDESGTELGVWPSPMITAKALGISKNAVAMGASGKIQGRGGRFLGYTFEFAPDWAPPVQEPDPYACYIKPEFEGRVDTDGLANLFRALNEKCFCETTPGFRSYLAKNVLMRYRRHRAKGLSPSLARMKATEIDGWECAHGHLNRWWQSFFDPHEVHDLLNRRPVRFFASGR